MTTSPFETLLLETPSTVHIEYTVDNVKSKFSLPFKDETMMGQIKVERTVKLLNPDSFEINYRLIPQDSSVELNYLEFEYDMNLEAKVMMAEGFQCWSTTKEMGKYNRLAAIPSVVSWFTKFNLQGDYDFFNYSGQVGHIHSTGYTYLRDTKSNHIVFLGSISEESGYTYYKGHLDNNKFFLYKDIDGKRLEKHHELCIQLYVSQGDHIRDLGSIWEKYADYYDPLHEFKNPRHLTGWSSWYNHYERVTEGDVMSSLNAFKEHQYPIDVFQIDDGFESQVGDWLEVDKVKFPRGMKALADDIKEQNYIPGIWLAPFAVGFKSKIVKEHPEWLLKYPENGSLVVAGPNWGGFYAIDIYHDEARRYLQHVFDQVIDVWGYKLIKLDFLFAAAMIPRLGKSRGEIMWDAMEFVMELVRKRAMLLGSGVPLPFTWGRLEYSRVSSDASPWWDDSVLRIAQVRERVSSYNAITSTLNRWPMGSTMFGSDPDVFFIRSNNNKLTKEEKHTLLIVNLVFGQLTLMSDNVQFYDKQEHTLYSSIFPKPVAHVQELVSIGLDIYQASYQCNGRDYIFISNISPLPFMAQLPLASNGEYDYFFEHSNVLMNGGSHVDWYRSQTQLFLKPHETRIFMRIASDSKDIFMGSTGHIVPGAEIESLRIDEKDSIHITLKRPYMRKKNRIYLKLKSDDSELPTVYVDGQSVSRIEKVIWNQHVSVAKIVIS
ncbi:glycoside hydrolase superfamily [Cokeromyces recurvatus]|uniref:glycoside hydrolase superfamily n=1 Tax=Cokeromyces recurvatus TaxID=90255 RepID=UPI00221E80C8|nr:glycoside hydrolase superfamily [Cokeromyces recurvatus]KAI7902159.1 glycoside hydrolase superfamily [Cokeromyces recurvatus]